MRNLRGYLFIIAATVFWGVSATTAKFLAVRRVDMLVLVQMRMTLSCLALLAYFLVFRRDFLRIRFRDFYLFALLGICGVAGSNFTYYFAIAATNVATAILLQYMAPLLVLAYAALTKEEALTIPKVTAAFVSLFGCFLAVGGLSEGALAINHAGLLFGIASAFCWGFTNIMLRKVLSRYRTWTAIIYAFIAATIFWQFFNPVWKIVAAGYTGEEWGMFFVFAMISVLIPHSLYFTGARYLTATQTIITATIEPVMAIATAYVILGEGLSPLRLVGAALVLIAIVLLQVHEEIKLANIQ